MNNLLPLFSYNILPIFLVASAGFLLSRSIEIDPRSVSRVIFYLFSPCLVFQLLTESQLDGGEAISIAAFAVAITVLSGIITWLVARALKFDRHLMAAMLLTTMFTNAGNFGLSLVAFAFGKDALAYASIFFITSATMIYTIGVMVASMGKTDFKRALLSLLRLPTLYALMLALLFNNTGWALPVPLGRSVELLGRAAIPGMLVLLGMQLQQSTMTQYKLALGLATVIRLVISPLIGLGLSPLLGLQGAAHQASMIEGSMPTAVMTTVLATEFDVHPAFVTTTVTITTLLSPLTLTPILAILGS